MPNKEDPGKVPIGTTSAAGYSLTAAALAAAVVAFATGDRSAQTLGTITAAAVAVLAFLVTSAGRYIQAHAKINAAAPAPPIIVAQTAHVAPDAVDVDGRAVADAAVGVAVDAVADDEEPGDHFDAHPDIPVTAPEAITPDNVDYQRPPVGGSIA